MRSRYLPLTEEIEDFFIELRQRCRKARLTIEKQAEICGCSEQNIMKAYKNHAFSLVQYLLINNELKKLEGQKNDRDIRKTITHSAETDCSQGSEK